MADAILMTLSSLLAGIRRQAAMQAEIVALRHQDAQEDALDRLNW